MVVEDGVGLADRIGVGLRNGDGIRPNQDHQQGFGFNFKKSRAGDIPARSILFRLVLRCAFLSSAQLPRRTSMPATAFHEKDNGQAQELRLSLGVQ